MLALRAALDVLVGGCIARAAVEHVVLDYEDEVEHYGEQAETELDRVAEDVRPPRAVTACAAQQRRVSNSVPQSNVRTYGSA